MKTVTLGIKTLRRKERLAETLAPIKGDFFFNLTPLKLFLTYKFLMTSGTYEKIWAACMKFWALSS